MLAAACGAGCAFCAGMAPGLVALALLCAILLYNTSAKRVPVVGPLVMGLCRGLDVILGAAAAGNSLRFGAAPLAAALLFILYIAAVTTIAARETEAFRGKALRFAPGAAAAAGFVLLWAAFAPEKSEAAPLDAALCAGAVGLPFFLGSALEDGAPPEAVQAAVGGLIRGLLVIQAALVAFFRPDFTAVAGVLILLFPVARRISARFYAS